MGQKRIMIAVALATLVWPLAVRADKPASTPLLTRMTRNGQLQFNLASGRITLHGRRQGSMNSKVSGIGRSEKLKMQYVGGRQSMTYERKVPAERLRIEVSADQQIHVRRSGNADSKIVPMDFSQSPGGPTTLVLGADAQREVYRAAGLWRLLMMHPGTCREYLVPVLKLLRSDWKLAETAEEAQRELLRMAADGEAPDPRTWATWVEQLADERFARREAADRRLRGAGSVVLSYLRGLEFAQLDAEQQYRIRRIIASLSRQDVDDTPKSIARRLFADPTVWLALLGHDDESTRRQAAEILPTLLDGPVTFDPAGDPAARSAQIEEIRGRLRGE